MPKETNRDRDALEDGAVGSDEPIPAASEETVLDATARLAREGRKELEADPNEQKPK